MCSNTTYCSALLAVLYLTFKYQRGMKRCQYFLPHTNRCSQLRDLKWNSKEQKPCQPGPQKLIWVSGRSTPSLTWVAQQHLVFFCRKKSCQVGFSTPCSLWHFHLQVCKTARAWAGAIVRNATAAAGMSPLGSPPQSRGEDTHWQAYFKFQAISAVFSSVNANE